MLVKVQIPLGGDMGQALVYNEKRDHLFFVPIKELPKDVYKKCKPTGKAYFEYDLEAKTYTPSEKVF